MTDPISMQPWLESVYYGLCIGAGLLFLSWVATLVSDSSNGDRHE